MSTPEKRTKKKGAFGGPKLSVAGKYVYPTSLRSVMAVGLAGGLAVIAYFFFDAQFQRNSFLSSGPLTAHHASIEEECSSCHVPFESVTDEKCSACHEKSGNRMGNYSFATHYVYRSKEARRAESAKIKFAALEAPCYSCHMEHLGRQAMISAPPDARCLGCHAFGSFATQHPQFDFAAKRRPDDAYLTFTHINHVREHVARKDPEKSCAHCHRLEPDGKHFAPISFEANCGQCHLSKKDEPKHKDLTALSNPRNPCRVCHVVMNGDVVPVQAEQRVLYRAEFDHHQHVLLKKCLECHAEIPMVKGMTATASAGMLKDGAAIQNIPKIENCRECHAPARGLDRCATCHDFHPNKVAGSLRE